MKSLLILIIILSLFGCKLDLTDEPLTENQIMAIEQVLNKKLDNGEYHFTFWASWCLPCIHEITKMKIHFDKVPMRKDVSSYAIAFDDSTAVNNFLVSKKGIFKYHQLIIDKKLIKQFQAGDMTMLPYNLIIKDKRIKLQVAAMDSRTFPLLLDYLDEK